MMITKAIIVFLSLMLLGSIVDLARRGRLTFKYAFSWLLLCGLTIFFTFYHKPLQMISQFFGFTLMSNFIFFIAHCFFIGLSLLLTIFLCQQNIRNDRMAQKIAHLELKISKIEKLKN